MHKVWNLSLVLATSLYSCCSFLWCLVKLVHWQHKLALMTSMHSPTSCQHFNLRYLFNGNHVGISRNMYIYNCRSMKNWYSWSDLPVWEVWPNGLCQLHATDSSCMWSKHCWARTAGKGVGVTVASHSVLLHVSTVPITSRVHVILMTYAIGQNSYRCTICTRANATLGVALEHVAIDGTSGIIFYVKHADIISGISREWLPMTYNDVTVWRPEWERKCRVPTDTPGVSILEPSLADRRRIR